MSYGKGQENNLTLLRQKVDEKAINQSESYSLSMKTTQPNSMLPTTSKGEMGPILLSWVITAQTDGSEAPHLNLKSIR
jgi:hypothetical protein